MAWNLRFSQQADKSLRKLDKSVSSRIIHELELISTLSNPFEKGHALKGNLRGLWRYRIGDYRAVCSIEHNTLIILVIDIDHRSRVYQSH